jgi:FKBP-type peptidyl-prolyl cis-trans isomerase
MKLLRPTLFIACLAAGAVFFAACGGGSKSKDNTSTSSSAPSVVGSRPLSPALFSSATATTEGLKVVDERQGSGAVAKAGDVVTVDYLGTFTDGKKFDASADHGQAFQFVLGQGNVIPGWDLGVAGMKPGGVRLLYVPYALGYGARGYGPIPPKADLIFEVKLEKIGQ